jgi:hypothetical protein
MIKVKSGKDHPGTGHEGPVWEKRYNSTRSLTLALGWSAWSTPRPGRFNPRKETRYLSYRRLDGPQGRSGRVRKISPLPCIDPRTVQPVASHTDHAISAPEPSWRDVYAQKHIFLNIQYLRFSQWSIKIASFWKTTLCICVYGRYVCGTRHGKSVWPKF